MFENRFLLRGLIFAAIMLLAVESAGYYIGSGNASFGIEERASRKDSRMGLHALKAKNSALRQRLNGLTPNEIYIVIDTGRNMLYLRKGRRTLHEAVISSGSGNLLKDPSGKRQWIFDTPRGEYRIKNKYLTPVWIKPDWAFIEEGEAVPQDPRKRIENGVLGDYALGFGKGYFIHGTLYTRLLGRNVTHGCIRAGDRDLKTVYTAAGIGTRLFIF